MFMEDITMGGFRERAAAFACAPEAISHLYPQQELAGSAFCLGKEEEKNRE